MQTTNKKSAHEKIVSVHFAAIHDITRHATIPPLASADTLWTISATSKISQISATSTPMPIEQSLSNPPHTEPTLPPNRHHTNPKPKMPSSAFLPTPPLPPPQARPRKTCPRATHPPPFEDSLSLSPHPFPPDETSTLLHRMLHIALANENYSLAASLRDAQKTLQKQHPTYLPRLQLQRAIALQDFRTAAQLRDEISRIEMHAAAERCKPRFPLGLVVRHRRFGFRMVLFGADFGWRAPGRGFVGDKGLGGRGVRQPWYRAAVDVRDVCGGDNVAYVAEDDCVPAEPGVVVQHPITRIMFRGVRSQQVCPGYSWYVSVGD